MKTLMRMLFAVVLGLAMALAAYLGLPWLVIAVAAVSALAMASGWMELLDVPGRLGGGVVIAVCAAGAICSAALAPADERVPWIATSMALSVPLAFLHQMFRPEAHRERITESLLATVSGGVVAAFAAFWIVGADHHGSTPTVVAAAVALAAAMLSAPLPGPEWVRTTLGIGLAVAASIGVAQWLGHLNWITAPILGLAVGLLTVSLRNALSKTREGDRAISLLAGAGAKVAVTGMIAYIMVVLTAS